MPNSPKNKSEIVREKIESIVGGDEVGFRMMLVTFALERLIYRLSISKHRDKFVLKGGMLVRALSVDLRRMSQDLDLTGLAAAEAVRGIFEEVMSIREDDGLVYNTKNITVIDIMKGHAYGGKRVQTIAYLGETPAKVSIDVGFDTALVKSACEIEYPSLLDFKSATLRAHSPATVIAEKFQAVVAIGSINTRMKDYYDLLTVPKAVDIDDAELAEAIRATFVRRGTKIPSSPPVGLSGAFAKNPRKVKLWKAYLDKNKFKAANLSVAVEEIWRRLEVPCATARRSRRPNSRRQ